MKSNIITKVLVAMATLPSIALADGKYRGEDFLAGAVTSRTLKDGTIEAKNISEESLSLESPKFNFGDKLSYFSVPFTLMSSGTVASPTVATLFSDSNVTLKAQCYVTNTTLLPTLDIYPDGFTNGASMRGDSSATNLTSATVISSKKLFSVAAASGLASGPRMDGERTPVFFVALDGTVYYLSFSTAVNLPNQVSKCALSGFIFKITPEA